MDKSADNPKELSRLIDEQQWRECLERFLEEVADKSFPNLPTYEMVLLDTVCRRVLPEVLEHETLWMVKHPDHIRQMLELLTCALAVGYRPATTVDHIAWLRCLLAIEEAISGRIERVHKELCLIRSGPQLGSIPKPNGILRQRLQSIELTERSAAEFLKLFFAAYLEFLKRAGQYELSNHIENRIGKLLMHIERDEQRPGVVQALFYDKAQAAGHCRFVHVSMERLPGDKTRFKEPIEYARKKEDIIDAAMQEAATCARQAVDAWLKRTGYPDGLDERLVRWEIATVQGDSVKLERQFQGGSVALPLAVAIVSQYLVRPVPNDAAFTGAFTGTSVADSHILPVDGIPEKVEHAALSGCRLIYVPAANFSELNSKPALRNLISEHNARIVAVETLDQVCQELFPPEGSGRLSDTVKDVAVSLMEILHPAGYAQEHTLAKSTHQRYRIHVIVCSLLTAGLVFLEGWRLFKGFAPAYPSIAAWVRILVSTAVAFTGMVVSFALPAACLRHRKVWSWYGAAAVLAVCFTAATVLVGRMLPDFVRISSIYNAPPVAGLAKDLFIMWGFAWAIAANTFNAVAALEDLITKRQFVTARTCLRWDSPLEARMPVRCIHFPWKWGVLAIGIVAGYLIRWEIDYYATVDTSTAAGYWEVFLGLVRDLLFVAAIGEVMVFYKVAVAKIRRSLS